MHDLYTYKGNRMPVKTSLTVLDIEGSLSYYLNDANPHHGEIPGCLVFKDKNSFA